MPSAVRTEPVPWTPPPAVRVRGTVALIAGAGESARVYERFGTRLAADGYVVAAFEAAAASDAAAWLAGATDTPRILAGSDRGAAAVLRLATDGAAVDGLLIAALPADGADDTAAAGGERTTCPVHLGVLGEDAARSGSTSDPVPIPDADTLAGIGVPVLAVHGGADPIAPLDAARRSLRGLPRLELVETVGGLHDALNDASHRSVAATIVLWLERLRAQDVDAPIVRSVVV